MKHARVTAQRTLFEIFVFGMGVVAGSHVQALQ